MPPLHPMIVHFPIALAVFALVADVVGDVLRRPALYMLGYWSMAAAVVAAALAVAAGYFDMNRASLSQEVDGYVHLHLRIGWLVLAVLVLLAVWRWLARHWLEGAHRVMYRIASAVAVVLVVFQGWYGGEMVYAHGASVSAAGQGIGEPETARKRLDVIYDFLGRPQAQGHGDAAATGGSKH